MRGAAHRTQREPPQTAPQAARGGRAEARPHGPARCRAQRHVEPHAPLDRAHAPGEEAVQREERDEDIPHRAGRARLVPQRAEKIVEHADRRAEEQERARLTQLDEDRELHHRKSLDQKPDAVRSSS